MKTDPVVLGACLGWRPPTDQKIWQWGSRYVRTIGSERATFYDPQQTPWWMGPLEAFADFETRQIVCVVTPGGGKSAAHEVAFNYIASEAPGPALYVTQTDDNAKRWAETRLIPSLKANKLLANLWPEDRHKSRKLEIIWPHMPMIFSGANISSLQEISMRYLCGDECWQWTDGMMREFMARHHGRWNRKVLLTSQAGIRGDIDAAGLPILDGAWGSDFWQEWAKTDMADFSWRCSCGTEQPFSWDGMRFDMVNDAEGRLDFQESAKTARMECISCRKSYADKTSVRRWMSSSNIDNGTLGYISRNPKAQDNHKGYHVDSLALWWKPWSDDVLEFLRAQAALKIGISDPIRQWRQKNRAEFWSDDMSENKAPLVRSSEFSKIDHEDGQPIDGELKRFMTVDVGGDHYWVAVCAWKSNGRPRVLYEGYVPSDGKQEKPLLDIEARYAIPKGLTFVDIGFEQDRIIDLCAQHGWTGVKGDGNRRSYPHDLHGKRVERLYSKAQRQRAKSGGIAKYIFLATNPIKDVLSRMLANEQVELPGDLSKAFEKHMRAERRETIRNAKTGAESHVWVTKNRQNHLWDTMVYQVGAALVFRLFDATEDEPVS
jgi:phage terminase large subunit GpA-like protein